MNAMFNEMVSGMKNNLLAVGDVFIVPNALSSRSNTIGHEKYDGKDIETRSAKDRAFMDWASRSVHSKIVYPMSLKERYVEVWVHNSDIDNWGCHRAPWKDDEGSRASFPTYLPCSLFEGKKEGDTVRLLTPYGVVELHLSQLGCGRGRGYSKGEPFEALLQKLLVYDDYNYERFYKDIPLFIDHHDQPYYPKK